MTPDDKLMQQAHDALRQCKFTTPPAQRQIVNDALKALSYRLARPVAPLTDEQIEDCIDAAARKFKARRQGPCGQQMTSYDDWKYWLVREVEAAHGIGGER